MSSFFALPTLFSKKGRERARENATTPEMIQQFQNTGAKPSRRPWRYYQLRAMIGGEGRKQM